MLDINWIIRYRPRCPVVALLFCSLTTPLTNTHATPQKGKEFPNNDQGFGVVHVNEVLITPTSPTGLVTEVHGEWSPNCAACPKVSNEEVKEYTIQVRA